MRGGRNRIWSELHDEILYYLNRTMKPRKMGWVGHIACMGVIRNEIRLLENYNGRGYL